MLVWLTQYLTLAYTICMYIKKIALFYFNLSFFIFLKGIVHQQPILRLLPKCITPMTSLLFITNIWPEFAELLASHPITIHEFHSTGMDYL